MNKFRSIILGIAALLASCTSYQPMGITGGYKDAQLDENVFSVYFAGNGYTSRERAQDFALLRAAELTLTHGHTYFVILESDSYTKNSIYKSPTYSRTTGQIRTYKNSAYGQASTQTYGGQTYNIRKPRVNLVIMCFKEKDENINATFLNAEYVSRSIRNNYNIY